jgi:hypothetical protein
MTTATKTIELVGIRWASDRYADGRWRAYAWLAQPEGTPPIFAEVNAETSDNAFEGLRAALCRHFRKPQASIVNELGWLLPAREAAQ